MPNAIRGVLSSFLDALGPERSLVIKVAACLDSPFEFALLKHVYPHKAAVPELWNHVGTLCSNEFMLPDASNTKLPKNLWQKEFLAIRFSIQWTQLRVLARSL